MKIILSSLRARAGFTLVELMTAAAAGSIILGALMAGSLSLQRSFRASAQLAQGQADLIRVADFMARDIRNATTFNATPASPALLTVTTTDYYNRNGTPANLTDDRPNSPTLSRNGATYGGNPVSIRYVRSGTRLMREVTTTDGGTAAVGVSWIADFVENLSVSVDASRNVTLTVGSPMTYGRRSPGASSRSLSFVMAARPRNPAP